MCETNNSEKLAE